MMYEDGFEIERRTGSGPFVSLGTVPAGTTDFTDTTTVEATSYTYRVRAFNSERNSSYSPTASITVQFPGPASLNASAGTVSPSVDLTWTDNSASEDGFEIERRTGKGTFALIATVGANVTMLTDSTVLEKTSYGYRVRAFTTAGFSAYSAIASICLLCGGGGGGGCGSIAPVAPLPPLGPLSSLLFVVILFSPLLVALLRRKAKKWRRPAFGM